MQKTRKRIIQKLNSSPPMAATDLARALGLTKANIRYHLIILEDQGAVVRAGSRKPPSRGRPTHMYTSTLEAEGKDSEALVRAFWDEFIGDRPSRKRSANLRKLARRLMRGNDGQPKEGPLPLRLAATIRSLNSLGYYSRWEAHSESPHIVLDRCPFDMLLDQLPGMCSLDLAAVEEILGEKIEQISRRRLIGGRGSACVFRLIPDWPDRSHQLDLRTPSQ